MQRLRNRNASLQRLVQSYETAIRNTVHELDEISYRLKICEMERAQLQLERDSTLQDNEQVLRQLQSANVRAMKAQGEHGLLHAAYLASLSSSATERYVLSREVSRLRSVVQQHEQQQQQATASKCKICFDAIPDAAISCGHVFCVGCVERLCESEDGSCPVCRKVMQTMGGEADKYHMRLYL